MWSWNAFTEAADSSDSIQVNGRIAVPQGATAARLICVNGAVTVAPQAHVISITVTNGVVDIATGGGVDESICVVMGTITLACGSKVERDVQLVTGHLSMDAAFIGGSVRTQTAHVTLNAKAQVAGDIVVEAPQFGEPVAHTVPRIVIGPASSVAGAIICRRDVQLWVSTSARIGAVSGATPQFFSGEQPAE